jgi:hypothetical protein
MMIDTAKNLRDAEIFESVLNAGDPDVLSPMRAAAKAIEPDGAEMGLSVWRALAELWLRGSWDNLGPDDQRNVRVYLMRSREMAPRIRYPEGCFEGVFDKSGWAARDAFAKG